MEKYMEIYNFSNNLNYITEDQVVLKKIKKNGSDAIQKILNNLNIESLHKYPDMHFS
jgi:hypothetical protein